MKLSRKQYYVLLVSAARAGKFPARDVAGNCSYRTEDGRACAVGLLIPDNVYNEIGTAIESCAVSDTTNSYKLPNIYDQESAETVYDLIEDYVPDYITEEDLDKIQAAHDRMTVAGDDIQIEKFIQSISELACFKECV